MPIVNIVVIVLIVFLLWGILVCLVFLKLPNGPSKHIGYSRPRATNKTLVRRFVYSEVQENDPFFSFFFFPTFGNLVPVPPPKKRERMRIIRSFVVRIRN